MSLDELKEYLKRHHQAAEYIRWDLPIRVLQSGAGSYIGMYDPDLMAPLARFSCEYWATPEEAQEALETGEFHLKLWL